VSGISKPTLNSGWVGDIAGLKHAFRVSKWEPDMAIGTVKFFNGSKGYGFIAPDNGGPDVFVHVTAVEKAGMHSLAEGQKVSYDVVNERGKTAAANLAKA
jgi:CspA family cold shock protein